MIAKQKILRGFATAEARWARFGPYYAMFPLEFAFEVVEKYSRVGDWILDPFAGRCSSIYAGGVLGRHSLGIEINPVGWLYGKVKLQPADEAQVIHRLYAIYGKRNFYSRSLAHMPEFYRLCYCDEVLKFLLAARTHLDWRHDNVDATLMAIILIYLHGKLGEGLSNQMRMTKAMGMNYSVKWWEKHQMSKAPELNPCDFMLKKIVWRYAKGKPRVTSSRVLLGDSSEELLQLAQPNERRQFSLLFTSPPYCSVTNYHIDQWLRLWLLGASASPQTLAGKHQKRFGNKQEYYALLDKVFGHCARLMKRQSVVYVRTDRREFTFQSTLEILQRHFPKHSLTSIIRPLSKEAKSQTKLFGDKSLKPGEVDIIMTRG